MFGVASSFPRPGRRTVITGALATGLIARSAQANTGLLNVSYDPTRELYRDINPQFIEAWPVKSGQRITISQRRVPAWQSGEFVALLGPSGSCKTTLLRALAGLEQVDAGHMEIGGRSMVGVPAREHRWT